MYHEDIIIFSYIFITTYCTGWLGESLQDNRVWWMSKEKIASHHYTLLVSTATFMLQSFYWTLEQMSFPSMQNSIIFLLYHNHDSSSYWWPRWGSTNYVWPSITKPIIPFLSTTFELHGAPANLKSVTRVVMEIWAKIHPDWQCLTSPKNTMKWAIFIPSRFP